MTLTVSRREVFAGLALAAWSLPAVAMAQGTPALTWTPKALTSDQARALEAAADTIIPATDTPGAVEAGVPQFVDRQIADWCAPADAAALKAGLSDLDARAKAKGASVGFAALPPAQRTMLLGEVEADARRGQAPYWWQLKVLTTTGYFTSQAGATKAARYEAVPGAYRGCVPLKEIGRVWATA
jgi:hypothetical protein